MWAGLPAKEALAWFLLELAKAFAALGGSLEARGHSEASSSPWKILSKVIATRI